MKTYLGYDRELKELKRTTDPNEFFDLLWKEFSNELTKGYYNCHDQLFLFDEKDMVKEWIFADGMGEDLPDKKFFKENFNLAVDYASWNGEFTVLKINKYTWGLRTDGKIFNSITNLIDYLISHRLTKVIEVYNGYYGADYISKENISKALKRVIRARKNSYDYEKDTQGWNIEFLNDLNVEVGLIDCNGKFEREFYRGDCYEI